MHRLANALSRGAARRYAAAFGVTLAEWRILALLRDFAPMALRDLSAQAGLDKGQVSRTVSALVARGLVLRSAAERDGREVRLRPSAAGRRLTERLMEAARARDDAFRAVLTEEERGVLDGVLRRLLAEARRQGEPAAWAVSPPSRRSP